MCATNGRHNKTSDITIESSQRLLKGGLPESLTAKPSVDMGGTSEWEMAAGRPFVEMRFDSDGVAYTLAEFHDYHRQY